MAGIFDLGNPSDSTPNLVGPAVAPATGWGEVAQEAFDDFLLSRNFQADELFKNNLKDDRDALFKDISGGQSLYEEAIRYSGLDASKFIHPKSGMLQTDRPEVQEAANSYIQSLKEQDPDKYGSLLTNEDIEQRYIQEAKEKREDFELAAAGASPAARIGGSLIGGVAASFYDPINLATLPLGAGLGASVLKTAAIEAGINIFAEAATIPTRVKVEELLGGKYTAEDAFLDLSTAGLFGGIFGGGARKLGQIAEARIKAQNETIEKMRELGDNEMYTGAKAAQIQQQVDDYNLENVFLGSPLYQAIDDNIATKIFKGIDEVTPSKAATKTNIKKTDLKIIGLKDSYNKTLKKIEKVNSTRQKRLDTLEAEYRARFENVEKTLNEQAVGKSRKAKKSLTSDANIERTRRGIQKEFEAKQRQLNQEFDAQVSDLQKQARKIDGDIDPSRVNFKEDLKEVNAAILERRPINPGKISIDDDFVLKIDPDRMPTITGRVNLKSFQAMEKAKPSARVAELDGPIDPSRKALMDLVLGKQDTTSRTLQGQLDIEKASLSPKAKQYELDRLDELDPNTKAFADGDVDKKGNYLAEKTETVDDIKNEYAQIREAREALKSCGIDLNIGGS